MASSETDAPNLAHHLSVKAVEKFDVFLPEEVLDIANAHDRLNIGEAELVAKKTLNDLTP